MCILCVMPPVSLFQLGRTFCHLSYWPHSERATRSPKKEMFNWADYLQVVNRFCHITFLMQLLKILKVSAKLHFLLGVLDL